MVGDRAADHRDSDCRYLAHHNHLMIRHRSPKGVDRAHTGLTVKGRLALGVATFNVDGYSGESVAVEPVFHAYIAARQLLPGLHSEVEAIR